MNEKTLVKAMVSYPDSKRNAHFGKRAWNLDSVLSFKSFILGWFFWRLRLGWKAEHLADTIRTLNKEFGDIVNSSDPDYALDYYMKQLDKKPVAKLGVNVDG